MLELRAAIERHAAAGRIAFVLGRSGAIIGYDALLERMERYRAGAMQLEKGAPVGILAPRGLEAVAAFLGLMQAGACPCLMEPRLTAEATAERMQAVGMRLLLVEGESLAGATPLAALRQSGGAPGALPNLTPGDRAMMLFTSGSSGRPKGVLLSHGNLTSNARGVIAATGVTAADRLLHVMPLHHTNGVNNQLIVPLLAGATVILADRFAADQVPDLIAAHRVTYMTGVPTMYARLLPHMPGRQRFPSLRFLRCGSAPISASLHREIEAAFGVELLVSYGLSEATCTSTMNPPGARRIGTVGKPLPGQKVALFEPGTLNATAAGKEGEICISGPNVMLGYLGDGAESPIDRGWVRSGDLGRFDDDGYLSVTGRIKDVILRGGENLSPAQIETALAAHPSVGACCVVGRRDEALGEVPVAFVVLRPGQAVTAEPLQSHVAALLPRACVPVSIHFVDGLPEIGIGKVDRRALRLLAGDRVSERHAN